jgi:hypothetical protein
LLSLRTLAAWTAVQMSRVENNDAVLADANPR